MESIFRMESITVGTPGLGVRHPHGSNPGGGPVNDFPSGRFSIRMADAQTGRPYSNHFPILSFFHPDGSPSGWFPIRVADAQTGRPNTNKFTIK
jgi:hypothetical protein